MDTTLQNLGYSPFMVCPVSVTAPSLSSVDTDNLIESLSGGKINVGTIVGAKFQTRETGARIELTNQSGSNANGFIRVYDDQNKLTLVITGNAVEFYDSSGVFVGDIFGANAGGDITLKGLVLDGDVTARNNIYCLQNITANTLSAGNGVTDYFSNADSRVITITDGIITNIS